jgi:hypothetical protein
MSVSPAPRKPSLQVSSAHAPRTQCRPLAQVTPMHAGSTHEPFWQTKPTSQVCVPHARDRHLPPKHVESAGHITPTQSFSLQALFTQACDDEHVASVHERG